MATNKFKGLHYHQLVQVVQNSQIALNEKKGNRKKLLDDLAEARSEVMQYLKLLDRRDPTFYPKNSHVMFSTRDPRTREIKEYKAVVVRHTHDKVLLSLHGDPLVASIDPLDLKLLYIRPVYK